MGFSSLSGRARTNPRSPQAHAICDRCGARVNFVDLQWQYEWRGASLQNTRILVCGRCLDTPTEQLRAIIIPRDPEPIINARVENFAVDETDNISFLSGATTDPGTGLPIPGTTDLATLGGQNVTRQPLGRPRGLEIDAIMPLFEKIEYGVAVPFLSISSVGSTIVTVTCSEAHGLSTDAQIAVEGLSDTRADGFYSVTVTSGTAFTYQTNSVIPRGPLVTSETRMVTANVGIPRDYPQIPQTGP